MGGGGGPGGGFGLQKSSSEPVTYRELMMPNQISALNAIYPTLFGQASGAFQGYGLTPGEQMHYKQGLYGDLNEMTGGMRSAVRDNMGTFGQQGGVVNSAMKNIDAAKIMAMSQGLQGIWDLNERARQEKINRLLQFAMWAPPSSMRSKGTGFNIFGGLGGQTSTGGGDTKGGGAGGGGGGAK